MIQYIIVVTVFTLLSLVALGIIGYFAYKFGHNQGHTKGYKTGYDAGHGKGYEEAQEKYKQLDLTPEQKDAKEQHKRLEDRVKRLMAYSPIRR